MIASYRLTHPDHKPFLVIILQDDEETLDVMHDFLEHCRADGWSVDVS
jgi:hypothetical protein